MKKYFISAILTLTMVATILPLAQAIDDDWYIYNGESGSHNFSFRFPQNWGAKEMGDAEQGFAPKDMKDKVVVKVREFEGQTYEQAMSYYTDESTQLTGSEDVVIASGEDLLGKKATYTDKEILFVKRGGLILSISRELEGLNRPDDLAETATQIQNSIRFSDDWHQYIDYREGYTFIFPANLNIENFSEGVRISSAMHGDIFEVRRYAVGIEDVAGEAEGYAEDLEDTEEIVFHGIKNAIIAEYFHDEDDKLFSRVFVEKNGVSYGMTNVNIEPNYPHLNYYDQYIAEILESFEFFDVGGENYSYLNFPDVRENHVNATAIDALANEGVIAGYPDGTFRPDGEINRAELTKLIVAVGADPKLEKYSDCFPDVNDEWFAPFVCYAKEKGWVEGYDDGTFRPDDPVNRAEAMKIVLEVLFEDGLPEITEEPGDVPEDANQDAWYYKYLEVALSKNLLDMQHITETETGYNYFISKEMTRKEVAEMIYRTNQTLEG